MSTSTCSRLPMTHSMQLDVALEHRQLVLEPNLVIGGRVDRESQQIRQADDHRVRGVGVAVDELGDRVQRVEEKVRVQLRPERVEARGGQLRVETQRLHVPMSETAIQQHRVERRDERRIREQVRREPVEIRRLEELVGSGSTHDVRDGHQSDDPRRGAEQTDGGVNADVSPAIRRRDRKALGRPEGHGHQGRHEKGVRDGNDRSLSDRERRRSRQVHDICLYDAVQGIRRRGKDERHGPPAGK